MSAGVWRTATSADHGLLAGCLDHVVALGLPDWSLR